MSTRLPNTGHKRGGAIRRGRQRVTLEPEDLKILREVADALMDHSQEGRPISRAKFLALRLWMIWRRSEPAKSGAAYKRTAAALAYTIRRELNPGKRAKQIYPEVAALSGYEEDSISVIVAKERAAIKRFLAYVDMQAPGNVRRRAFLQECLIDNDKVFP